MNRLAGKVMRVCEQWRLARAVKRILRTLDLNEFKVCQKKYLNASPDPGYSKYLNIEHWLLENLRYVFLLNLQNSKPLRILDIGTGCGYFPYACKCYGHSVTTLDLDLVPMYKDIVKFLQLDRRVLEIKAFERLPDLGCRFDLVSALMVCFNHHNKPDLWGPKEWQFFLSDLATNQLKEDGRVFLKLNAEKSGGHYSDELLKFFLNRGAQADGGQVYFRSMRGFTGSAAPFANQPR
jgi:hypothetical protein